MGSTGSPGTGWEARGARVRGGVFSMFRACDPRRNFLRTLPIQTLSCFLHLVSVASGLRVSCFVSALFRQCHDRITPTPPPSPSPRGEGNRPSSVAATWRHVVGGSTGYLRPPPSRTPRSLPRHRVVRLGEFPSLISNPGRRWKLPGSFVTSCHTPTSGGGGSLFFRPAPPDASATQSGRYRGGRGSRYPCTRTRSA